MKTVKEAIKFRRTMPEFDTTKKINSEDLETIINAGRLAPSALGAETTRVLVIRDPKIKTEIAKSTFRDSNWKKVMTADSLILFVSQKGKTLQSKEFLTKRLQRWNLTEENLKNRVSIYVEYLSSMDADVYSANQAFITLGYMSLQTAALGIESTIMQGFHFKSLNDFLAKQGFINPEKEAIHISMAIGYSKDTIRSQIYPQKRISIAEFCEII